MNEGDSKDQRDQTPTNFPAGSGAAPENPINCNALSAYQCHSLSMNGLSKKLNPNIARQTASIYLDPNLSINLPHSGAVKLPRAAKDNEALILDAATRKAITNDKIK